MILCLLTATARAQDPLPAVALPLHRWALLVDPIARHGPHPQAMIVGPQGEVP